MPATSAPSREARPATAAEHRDPVVAVGVDRAAAQAAGPLDRHPVGGRLDLAAERRERRGHGRDPVRLLAAQLRRRRRSSSSPRRSRPRARPAAARRSPAGPRRRRPRWPAARRGRGRAAVPAGSPPRSPSSSTSISAPIRSSTPSSPVRVGLRPTPVRVDVAAGHEQGARPGRRRRRRSRPGRRSGPASSRSAGARPRRPRPAAARRRRRRLSMRSLWSRLGSGSTTRVSPSASRPAKSRHDLTWALATGSS